MDFSLFNIFSYTNIIVFILIFTRLTSMIMVSPLFSTYPIPIQVKIWLMAIISFIFLPIILNTNQINVPTSMPVLVLYIVKEFFIGFTIGFVANFLFHAIKMSGQIVSMQSSLSYSNMLDPSSGEQTPVISELYTLLLSVVFLSLNAHHYLFMAVYNSYSIFPLGIEEIIPSSLLIFIIKSASSIFILSLNFIFPIFCILFVLQVLLGVLSKMIPQLNIFMVAMPLQVFVAFILMIVFLRPMFEFLLNLVQNYFTTLLNVFTLGF